MAALFILLIKISVALNVFALGLTATPNDVVHLFRRPGKLLRSLLSMYVVMPTVAVTLALTFNLHPAVKIALGVLAVSPTPPLLPRKALKAGGKENYAVGLLVATAVLTIVLIPLSLSLYERIFALGLQTPVMPVLTLVLTTVLGPLAAGMVVRAVAPELAHRMVTLCSTGGIILVILAILPVLVGIMKPMLSLVGDGTLAAFIAFAFAGLFAGDALGGPLPEDREVLAIYTISRHPGIAIAIAQANFPQQRLALPAIIMAAIVCAIASIPYLSWAKRRTVAAAGR
jgi:BASS family bile acid:Na+ symporter